MTDFSGIDTLFIDADDTLWENEFYFRDAEAKFGRLLAPHSSIEEVQHLLWEKQEENIPLFGYGSKTYLIGMIDAAMEICGGRLDEQTYRAIKKIITELAYHPAVPFDGVAETLEALSSRYRLVLATKGDGTEQNWKIEQSGLKGFFSAVEVMKNKDAADYRTLAAKYGVPAQDMLMVGNSVRSDIIPVIAIGGRAVFIPHEIVWVHEIAEMPESDRIIELNDFSSLKELLLA